jgi:hypothetical protein
VVEGLHQIFSFVQEMLMGKRNLRINRRPFGRVLNVGTHRESTRIFGLPSKGESPTV